MTSEPEEQKRPTYTQQATGEVNPDGSRVFVLLKDGIPYEEIAVGKEPEAAP